MAKGKNRQHIKQEMDREFTGKLNDIVGKPGDESAPIKSDCWGFSNDHRGVEPGPFHPNKSIRSTKKPKKPNSRILSSLEGE